jgi:hypothetical protein
MFLTFLASIALAFHPVSPFHFEAPAHKRAACQRTYTVAMGVRAIDATFSGGLPANTGQTARLRRYIRCQRNRAARPYLRHLWTAHATPAPMLGPATASWYYDAGSTGCGFHAALGVATLIAPCGSRLRICNGSACIVATRDDSGPYVAGRTFDLDPSARAALGCADLCAVTWRRVS